MMPPDCSAADAMQLKAWYTAELRELQDELAALRAEMLHDRAVLRRIAAALGIEPAANEAAVLLIERFAPHLVAATVRRP